MVHTEGSVSAVTAPAPAGFPNGPGWPRFDADAQDRPWVWHAEAVRRTRSKGARPAASYGSLLVSLPGDKQVINRPGGAARGDPGAPGDARKSGRWSVEGTLRSGWERLRSSSTSRCRRGPGHDPLPSSGFAYVLTAKLPSVPTGRKKLHPAGCPFHLVAHSVTDAAPQHPVPVDGRAAIGEAPTSTRDVVDDDPASVPAPLGTAAAGLLLTRRGGDAVASSPGRLRAIPIPFRGRRRPDRHPQVRQRWRSGELGMRIDATRGVLSMTMAETVQDVLGLGHASLGTRSRRSSVTGRVRR
jgi:hypothetical protein